MTLEDTDIKAASDLFFLASGARPRAVDSSAANFINADMGFRRAMVMKAIDETMNIEGVPNRSSAKIMGTPIKSNFKVGKIGKGTFNLRTSIARTVEARMAVPAMVAVLKLFMRLNLVIVRV